MYNLAGVMFVANSLEGPVIFHCTYVKYYKTYIAIIPHFNLTDTLTFISGGLLGKICVSNEIQSLLDTHNAGDIKPEFEVLAKRLQNFNFSSRESRIGITNEEIQNMAYEVALIIGDFCGCDLYIKLTRIHEEDLLNAFSIDAYVFALTCYCFVARNYYKQHNAELNFIFDQYGFYFDFAFEPVSCYKGMNIYDYSPEMQYFKYRADPLMLMFLVENRENTYNIRTFTWQRELMYYGLKQKSRDDDEIFDLEFDIYNLDILE